MRADVGGRSLRQYRALELAIECRKEDSSVSTAAPWRELQLSSVHAIASASRARAISQDPNG